MPVLRTLLASLIVASAGGAALAVATAGFQAFTSESARRIAVRAHPPEVPVVLLQTHTGTRVSLADFRGRWLLVDFIYTRCTTLCQALGAEFAQLQDRLAVPLAQDRVALLSISFDPDYDAPPELAAYLQRSGSRGAGWIAARPVEPEGLKRLKRSFRVTVIPDAFGGYTHNAAIHIVDPRGRLVEIVDLGNAAAVAQDVLQRLEH